MSVATEQPAVDAAGHIVQFYGRDEQLVEAVGTYLLAALHAEGVGIVVATAAHRAAFETHLARAGVDVEAAKAGGALQVLDADETMRRFLVGDHPDPGAFRSVIGGLIQQAGHAGRPTHVYGEMVALLWDAGNVTAAIELETLWNELGTELPFSLYCAYPAASVADDADRDALHQVCQLHTAVVGDTPVAPAPHQVPGRPDEAERTFARSAHAPGAARRFVLELLEHWGEATVVDDAALVVTEFATNAVTHAESDFTVVISRSPETITVLVRDAGPVTGTRGEPALAARPGHGLGVVAAVASRWGTAPLDGGKSVWAELRRSAAAAERGMTA
jgi:hypothetical protein